MTRSNMIAFAAFCLLAGSGWILDAALPAVFPGALGLLVHNVLLASAFFLVSRHRLPPAILRIALYTALILALPGVLVSLVDGRISSTTIVLVYALVPAATIFFAAQSSQEDLLRLLGPALAGFAGGALILPFALPCSPAGQLLLAGIVLSALAAGFAGIRLHHLLNHVPPTSAAALAASVSAMVALPLYAVQHPVLVLPSWQQTLIREAVHLAVQAATLFLTVRLLRELGPIAFSTRYLLIPFVTIIEGYLIVRPAAPWTLPAGILLLLGGCLLLLRPQHQA